MRRVVFMLLCTGLFAGCGLILPPKFLTLENVALQQINQDSLTIDLALRFRNPNRISARLYRLDYSILLDGLSAGHGSWSGESSLPAHSDFTLEMPLTIPRDCWPVWVDAFQASKPVTVEVMDTAYASVWFLRKSLAFQTKIQFDFHKAFVDWAQSELPKTKPHIERVAWRESMPESSMLQVKLSFDNPYQVAFTVDSMRADVKLNDISVGELTSQTPFNVSGGERVSNNYDLVVETLPSGSALLSGVLHRGWICRVDGNVYVSMSGVAVTVPIHLSRKIL